MGMMSRVVSEDSAVMDVRRAPLNPTIPHPNPNPLPCAFHLSLFQFPFAL